MKKKKKRKLHFGRISDIILSILLIIISFYTAFTIHKSNLLPFHLFIIACAILAILVCIFVLLTFKRLSWFAAAIKRLFIILLCFALLWGGKTINTGIQSLENIASVSETTINMRVLVKKDTNITSFDQLKNAAIGIQTGTDADNGSYMKQEISNTLGSRVRYLEYDDYTSMANALLLEYNDAMAISDSYLNMLYTNIEGFKDKVEVVKTFQRTIPIQETASTKDITKEAFTILISGMDEVGSPDQNLRSDVNILLIVNPATKHIQTISFPRDVYIPNVALKKANDKLTHTGLYGIDTTVQSLEYFLGIDIDFYAKVSFSSLIGIVDVINGIDVDVEIDFCEQDEERNFSSGAQICLNAGQQQLNGKQALAYARHRYTEGYDVSGRERAQQRIIKGIIAKLASPSGITSINALLEAAPNFVLTNMSVNQITSFTSSQIQSLKPWTISSTTLDQSGWFDTRPTASWPGVNQDVYLFSMEEIQKVLYAYENYMKPLDFNDFQFDLSGLYATKLQLNKDPNIAWSIYAINPH